MQHSDHRCQSTLGASTGKTILFYPPGARYRGVWWYVNSTLSFNSIAITLALSLSSEVLAWKPPLSICSSAHF